MRFVCTKLYIFYIQYIHDIYFFKYLFRKKCILEFKNVKILECTINNDLILNNQINFMKLKNIHRFIPLSLTLIV